MSDIVRCPVRWTQTSSIRQSCTSTFMLERMRTSVNAVSCAPEPGCEDQATEIFLAAFTLMTDDADSAKAEARGYKTVQQWREKLQVRTGLCVLEDHSATSRLPTVVAAAGWL